MEYRGNIYNYRSGQRVSQALFSEQFNSATMQNIISAEIGKKSTAKINILKHNKGDPK